MSQSSLSRLPSSSRRSGRRGRAGGRVCGSRSGRGSGSGTGSVVTSGQQQEQVPAMPAPIEVLVLVTSASDSFVRTAPAAAAAPSLLLHVLVAQVVFASRKHDELFVVTNEQRKSRGTPPHPDSTDGLGHGSSSRTQLPPERARKWALQVAALGQSQEAKTIKLPSPGTRRHAMGHNALHLCGRTGTGLRCHGEVLTQKVLQST